MAPLDDLLKDIFGDKKPAFYPEFEGWVRKSRRFKAFAHEYRNKIRSKLRNVRDKDGLHDVYAELQTAALFLHEKRFTLEYEKYAALKQRGPDFTLTFKTHTPFNVEVRRIRSTETDNDEETRITKLMGILCDKAGQMPPSIINLLWLTAPDGMRETQLTSAATTLITLAEQKTEDFFTRRGFNSAADFLKQYRRLSGIVLHAHGEQLIWLNPLARHPAPSELVRTLQRLTSP